MVNILWPPPPADFRLPANAIHIWCATLEREEKYVHQAAQTLSVAEQTRTWGFHFEQDKKYFIVRRGILRAILGRYLNVEPAQLRFEVEPYGKPALAQPFARHRLHFNVSHSSALALYAIARDQEVGIDLERIQAVPEAEQIAAARFSSQENQRFRALPPAQRHEAFFNCWTRKEAYIKATGRGLTQPLDTFVVSLDPGEPARLLAIDGDREKAARWTLHELTPAAGYKAALAVEGQDWTFHCWRWTG